MSGISRIGWVDEGSPSIATKLRFTASMNSSHRASRIHRLEGSLAIAATHAIKIATIGLRYRFCGLGVNPMSLTLNSTAVTDERNKQTRA